MKWSLRTVFLIIAIIAAALAWRANFRNQSLKAANEVESMGGEVSYQSQQPIVTPVTRTALAAYSAKPIPVQRKRADGTNYTEYTTQSYTAGMGWPFVANEIKIGSLLENQNHWSLWFSNKDVIVEAVQVHEAYVDEDFVEALSKFRSLKTVIVLRPNHYFRVRVCNSGYHSVEKEQLAKRLKELAQPFEVANALIKDKLPDVEILEGVAGR